jgi:hypothetical protein
LERRRTDTYWECAAKDVTGMRVRGNLWLVVETPCGAETFRVFGASEKARWLEEALNLTATTVRGRIGLPGAPS